MSRSRQFSKEIDRICDEFERDWQAGEPRAIEEYLKQASATERSLLLQELVGIDAFHRARQGLAVVPADYVSKFPELQDSIDELLRDAATQSLLAPLGEHTCVLPSSPSSATSRTQQDEEFPAFDAANPCSGMQIGPYRLDRKLGAGGMGTVWQATHLRLEKTVALKLLSPHLMGDPQLIARFDREMKAVGRLEHPHLVRAYDAGEHRGTHYLAMEYIDGQDLAQLVEQRGPLPPTIAIEFIRQASLGLAAAHTHGLIHRDIKPGNLMVTKAGQLKVTDLGLARLQSDVLASGQDGALTSMGQILGTPDYMAPEQWDNTHAVDGRCDLYALGCTLFFLLTGRAPFANADYPTLVAKMKAHAGASIPSLDQMTPGLPRGLSTIYERLLAKEPGQRFARAEELVSALDAISLMPATAANADSPSDQTLVAATPEFQAFVHTSLALQPNQVLRRESATPRKFPVWLVTVAALLLLAIIVMITNKDSSYTEIKVPVGEKVEVIADQEPPANPATVSPDRAAAEWVLSVGGKVTSINGKGQTRELTKGPVPDGDWELQIVDLIGCQQVKDDDLRLLGGCRRLRSLNLHETPVTGAGLKYLPPVASLRELVLGATKLNDETAALLAPLKQLSMLHLDYSADLTDQALVSIGELPQLHGLGLKSCTQLSDDGIAHLHKLTSLRYLSIAGTQITDAGLSTLVAQNPQLEQIYVASNRGKVSHTLAPLAAARSLTYLNVSGDLLADSALPILRGLPKLQVICVVNPTNTSAVERLSELINVPQIVLFINVNHDQGPSDAGYAALAKHPALENLYIHGVGQSPTDAALESLAKLPKLQTFKLEFSEQYNKRNYTVAGVARFRELRPDVHLTVDGVDYPTVAPKPAIAPFNAEQAQRHQAEWAKYLGVPVEYTNSIGMKFRLIPPGEYVMGSRPDEVEAALKSIGDVQEIRDRIQSELPQHKAILTRPFYLGTTEVTQAQYERVAGSNPASFSSTGKQKDAVSGSDTDDFPVETVSWDEAVDFCEKLTQLEERVPSFFRLGYEVHFMNGSGYRLPTEAEWEFACRAGTETQFWSGEQDRDLSDAGWFANNSGLKVHAVAKLSGNPFGLHDVHGNVFEWAHDYWDPTYYAGFADRAAVDRAGPSQKGSQRVFRGGYYQGQSAFARSSGRLAYGRTVRAENIGFRVVLPIEVGQDGKAIGHPHR